MLKRFLFIVFIVISTMNLNAANFNFNKSYQMFSFRAGIGTNSYFSDEICSVWNISVQGNICLKKSYYLQVEPGIEIMIGEKKAYKSIDAQINYKIPFLLNYKLGRHGFLLGLSMGLSSTGSTESDHPSFNLALSGGYEIFISKRFFFDTRLNLGLYSAISEIRTSSVLLGIGYKPDIFNR